MKHESIKVLQAGGAAVIVQPIPLKSGSPERICASARSSLSVIQYLTALLHESTQRPMINSHIWRSFVQAAVMVTNAAGSVLFASLRMNGSGRGRCSGSSIFYHLHISFKAQFMLPIWHLSHLRAVGVNGCHVTATWEVFYCPPSTSNSSNLILTIS